jgi:hypothetical protein
MAAVADRILAFSIRLATFRDFRRLHFFHVHIISRLISRLISKLISRLISRLISKLISRLISRRVVLLVLLLNIVTACRNTPLSRSNAAGRDGAFGTDQSISRFVFGA